MDYLSFGIAEFRSLMIGAAIFLAFVYLKSGKRYNWPQGPAGLPLLGNLVLFWRLCKSNSLSEEVTRLMRKHGNYLRIKLAHKNIVFIGGKEAIKEGWQKKGDAFGGRPTFFPTISHLSDGKG